MNLGPDAARYLIAAQGKPVARPFHLRWLLPALCGTDLRRWWAVWAISWPILGVGTFWLADLGWQRSLLAAVLVMALPGVWGPAVVRPVGVDLPAMALTVCGAAAASHGVWWAAVLLVGVASMIRETSPVWAALFAWNPVVLICLVFPAFTALTVRPVVDEVTAVPHLREVYDHPFATAISYRKPLSQPNWPWWRNAWIMVAPWGICLAALYRPDWRVLVVLVIAHLQLLVATDTARLLHTGAGPAMGIGAAAVIPSNWLLLAAVAHVFWWHKTEVM